jgi:hypothetical protein
MRNPYGDGAAAPRIVRILREVELGHAPGAEAIRRPAVTLAVLASRKGYLKVLGAFIQAALMRGHGVVLSMTPTRKNRGRR